MCSPNPQSNDTRRRGLGEVLRSQVSANRISALTGRPQTAPSSLLPHEDAAKKSGLRTRYAHALVLGFQPPEQ